MNIFQIIHKRGIKASLYKLRRMLFIRDKQVLASVHRLGTYDYLTKYSYALTEQHSLPQSPNPFPGKIWVCWLQGIENAPQLIQTCVESIKRHANGKEVVLLSEENIRQYVQIPDYIYRKYRNSIMPPAHYSDWIRVYLLSHYGGVWIDATVFLSDTLPDDVFQNELFCFKSHAAGNVIASNWFIASRPNSPVMLRMLALLSEYWKHEDKFVSYDFFHLFFYMVINSSSEYKQLWKSIPTYPDVNCFLLSEELFEPFQENRFRQITRLSSVHKLSYKYPVECYERPNTLYKHIILQSI